MDVSIVIVNYNTCRMTLDCIDSVFNYTHDIDFEVIVVDNGSKDESPILFSKDSRICYIYNNDNLGFGSANNIGAKFAKGRYIFFLNSDTILRRNVVKEVFDFFNENHHLSIGALGILLEDSSGQFSLSFEQFFSVRSIVMNTLKRFSNRFSYQLTKRSEVVSNQYASVDYIIGADMFVEKITFDQLNGFNPKFFMFCEEEDLQRRMNYLKLKRFVLNINGIIHLESKSIGDKLSFRRSMMIKKSYFLYISLHYRYFKFFIIHLLYFFVRLKDTLITYSHLSIKQKLSFLAF